MGRSGECEEARSARASIRAAMSVGDVAVVAARNRGAQRLCVVRTVLVREDELYKVDGERIAQVAAKPTAQQPHLVLQARAVACQQSPDAVAAYARPVQQSTGHLWTTGAAEGTRLDHCRPPEPLVGAHVRVRDTSRNQMERHLIGDRLRRAATQARTRAFAKRWSGDAMCDAENQSTLLPQ
jgi:hypothetical protein